MDIVHPPWVAFLGIRQGKDTKELHCRLGNTTASPTPASVTTEISQPATPTLHPTWVDLRVTGGGSPGCIGQLDERCFEGLMEQLKFVMKKNLVARKHEGVETGTFSGGWAVWEGLGTGVLSHPPSALNQ